LPDSGEAIDVHRRSFVRFAQMATGIGLVIAAVIAVAVRGSATPNYFDQALSALKRGDKAQAIVALKANLQVAPDSASTRLQLASLLREGQPEEAMEILNRIPRGHPEWINALQQIAILHLLAERNDSAEKALQEVIAEEPQNFGAQLALAELYFARRDPKVALPHALEAARLFPTRAQTFLLVAEIYDELHNLSAMIEPLQTALAISPDFYAAHLNLAYAHHRIGQLAEAEEQAKWCLGVNPRDVAALRILASIACNDGRFDDAETHLAMALQIQPTDVDCRILEADLLLYRRKPREAYERLRELYDTNQTTVRFLGALARAATSAGERDEARELYQAVEQMVQKNRKAAP